MTPTIGVKLIQYDKFDTVRVRNDSAIQRILARHQQFKHHEVRKEDVRLLFADALALFLALLASVAGEQPIQHLSQPTSARRLPLRSMPNYRRTWMTTLFGCTRLPFGLSSKSGFPTGSACRAVPRSQ